MNLGAVIRCCAVDAEASAEFALPWHLVLRMETNDGFVDFSC
jgi:hypothetical protein